MRKLALATFLLFAAYQVAVGISTANTVSKAVAARTEMLNRF